MVGFGTVKVVKVNVMGQKKHTLLLEQEFRKFALALPRKTTTKYVFLALVLWETGLKLGQVMILTPLNFDFRNCVVRGTLNKKFFERCLTRTTLDAMLDNRFFELAEEAEPLWHTCRSNVYQIFCRAGIKALGRKVSPNLIRDSSAAHLISLGLSPGDVSVYFGSSRIAGRVAKEVKLDVDGLHKRWRSVIEGLVE